MEEILKILCICLGQVEKPNNQNEHQTAVPLQQVQPVIIPPPVAYPTSLSNPIQTNVPVIVPTPTNDELENLSSALERLWSLDDNALIPNQDFKLHLQSSTYVSGQVDKAPQPLFKDFNFSCVKSHQTINQLHSLLNNYTAETGITESLSASKIQEQRNFIDSIIVTRPIQYLHKLLVATGKASPNIIEFKKQLYAIWFNPFKRIVENDSSAFEHVFVGEISNGKVIGLHNWVQFLILEQKGHVNYRGYIKPRNGGSVSVQDRVLSLQLEWNGIVKPVSTILMGSSPELEISIYTLLFLFNQEQVKCQLNDTPVMVKVHSFRNRNGINLGAGYVEHCV